MTEPDEKESNSKMKKLSDALKSIYDTDDKSLFFQLGQIGTKSYMSAIKSYGLPVYDQSLSETTRCLCTTPISRLFVITLKANPTATRSVVGSCCIKQFGIERKRVCSQCQATHKNHHSMCNPCRKRRLNEDAKELERLERMRRRDERRRKKAEELEALWNTAEGLAAWGSNKTFKSGKYAGHTFYDVGLNHPSYIEFLREIKVTDPSLKRFMAWHDRVDKFLE